MKSPYTFVLQRLYDVRSTFSYAKLYVTRRAIPTENWPNAELSLKQNLTFLDLFNEISISGDPQHI